MANPNIAAATSILGVSGMVSSVATTGSTLLGAVTTAHVFKVNSITVANRTASACWVTVSVTRSAVAYNLAYQIQIPAYAVMNVLGKDMGIYLNEADTMTVTAQTASALDAIVSYEDIS